jgi:hypothetical protein
MSGRAVWRTGLGAAIVLAASATLAVAQTPAPLSCARTEFESAVDEAGEVLRTLTQKNSPVFQSKLRALKDKRAWSHDVFLAEGARFVRDDTISAFEEKSANLLAKINGAGAIVNATATDCARLADLKADMIALVEIQNEKWTYMFTTIDAELAK